MLTREKARELTGQAIVRLMDKFERENAEKLKDIDKEIEEAAEAGDTIVEVYLEKDMEKAVFYYFRDRRGFAVEFRKHGGMLISWGSESCEK